MKISRIKETCIYISNLHRTKEFYHVKLGLPLISLVENRHVFFRAGESVLLCFIAEQTKQEKELPPHGAKGIIHFAFEVDRQEYSKAVDQLREANITILQEHTWQSGLHSVYFADPDSNLVEIIEQGLWEN
jgi:catechol 2,3-dioxygenase-like lactoylglutathione lyase family enzyme